MKLLKNKEGHANIRHITVILVVIAGVLAAILFFGLVPTFTGASITSGNITFIDRNGTPVHGLMEIKGEGISSGLKSNVSFVSWDRFPNTRIYFNAMDTKNVSINLIISDNSSGGKVLLENYGSGLPGEIEVSAPGNPIKYVEISAFGVSFSEANISIQYKDAELNGLDENNLTIYQYNSAAGVWNELPYSIDAGKNTLVATVNSLSVFALSTKVEEQIEIHDTKNMPIKSKIRAYDEARALRKEARISALSTADVPDRGELEIDAMDTKNVSVSLKLKTISKVKSRIRSEIILDDYKRKNPVSVPLPGKVVKYIEIGSRNVLFSSANITIRYSESELNGGNEAGLTIYHWNGASWDALPTTVDMVNKTLSATSTSFSPFGVATSMVYNLENNATAQSVGKDGNINYSASGSTITVIPYKNLLKSGTMGAQANILYNISTPNKEYDIFRFYLPFDYQVDTRISANSKANISWKAASTSDIINISLIDYNPINGVKTVIGSTEFTVTGGATSTYTYTVYPATISNLEYIVPAGNRLMARINATAPSAGTVGLSFNNGRSNITVTETALGSEGAPDIISWRNNKTNDQSNSISVNEGETVRFNATANQTITTWNWYRDGINQNNNLDFFSTFWNAAGTKTVKVNATNANGTSSTISWTVTVMGSPTKTYIPSIPVNLASTQGNFWINYTWQEAGTGNNTDSYNVSVNSLWTNGTTTTYSNRSVGAHNWSNISVWAYNSSGSGKLSLTSASQNTQVANNVPVQTLIGNKEVTAGNALSFEVSATDMDSDPITYGTNATKGSLNPITGVYTWTTTASDAGTYTWSFNSSDNYGGVAPGETITVTVNPQPTYTYIPLAPINLTSTQGNFWVNNTWQEAEAGNNTDSYNVSVNGLWTNGTTTTYSNNSVGAHNWSNISVWAYNSSGSGRLSLAPASQNTQVANNVPVQVPIGNKEVTTGNVLSFTVSATDKDSDLITYVTNATKGSLNPITGIYTWTTSTSDAGTYTWSFNSSDNYGGVTPGETITVTVNSQPQVTYTYIPLAPINLASTQGNFWINYTWQEAGTGNNTDSYNVSVNGLWTNGTTTTYSNDSVGAHNWSNISVWAYNSSDSGKLSLTSASQNTQVANNVPIQVLIGDKTVTAGNTLSFTVLSIDRDSDPLIYNTNATKGELNPLTGVYTWTTSTSDAGTYTWSFNSSDNYGGVAPDETITVTVNPQTTYSYVPQAPINLTSTQGNFWINYTWQEAGTGNNTDSYNVSINGLWTNGTTATYSNNSVGAHNWSNITVWAYNSSGSGKLSLTSASQNTQVANNVPVQAPIGNRNVNAGNWLNLTVTATDVDSDPIVYNTNATKGAINPTSGAYSWKPGSGDVGTYQWYFNSSDNHGGVAGETLVINVTSNVPNITSWSNNRTNNGNLTLVINSNETVTFNATADQIVNSWNWYKDDISQSNNYDNLSTSWNTAGTKNVKVNVTNANGTSNTITWIITVNDIPDAPQIISWSNNKTNNDNLTLVLNPGEAVIFNATSNQIVNSWNWYKDDINQSNNYDNLSTSWDTAGIKNIKVNVTNANGTSNTITWTITVNDIPDAPQIISWSNNKTNNSDLTLSINTSEVVNFTVTADQVITVWNWNKDNISQNNNYDNFSTSWDTAGTKTVNINATNSNGISNTIMWTIIVNIDPDACTACHFSYSYMNDSGMPAMYVNQNMYNDSPHSVLGCKDCHTKGHNNIGARKACEDCHVVQQDAVAETERHNITGTPSTYTYGGTGVMDITDCTVCHDQTLYNSATSNYGYNKAKDCDYCHTYPDKYYE